ncbi:wax ester/triacylglycerol synthase domain-containing protein [Salinibacterium sp. ZJ454]|uniref:wax ester/triacylglycerol synthase domain-containing protein n=1 Tax=Salinibacterium sp. ZJ454 TaxID=2708339 RepID=UPI0014239197|nr:wax ester/triacylglycerol synthase domain-containing protein [Salinibacterium sp. ZJ454]
MRIDRVSADDLMSLAEDSGSVPMQVGAVLLLQTSDETDAQRVLDAIGRRISRVPRLRQRLVRVGWGLGRPVWVDDPVFDPARHLGLARCPEPGGEDTVLKVAAELLVAPLPKDRPLWTCRLLTDAAPGGAALIFVFHHVLADGIGGLAVLRSLVDVEADAESADAADATAKRGGAPRRGAPRIGSPPRPEPTGWDLAVDAAADRMRSLARLPAALHRLAVATTELRTARRSRLAASSLNRPTGPTRALAVVHTPRHQVRAAAHTQGATVNDVVLAAVAAALRRLLLGRGERLDEVVVSVPFATRRQTSATSLGNQGAVMPITVPALGPPRDRLGAVTAATTVAKRQPRGASTALLGPLFRLLARARLYRRFIDHQRLINTFVSNVHGPDRAVALLGWPVRAIIPLSAATGNVTVSFAVLSYADELTIALIADPDAVPDLAQLRGLLEQEISVLALLGT